MLLGAPGIATRSILTNSFLLLLVRHLLLLAMHLLLGARTLLVTRSYFDSLLGLETECDQELLISWDCQGCLVDWACSTAGKAPKLQRRGDFQATLGVCATSGKALVTNSDALVTSVGGSVYFFWNSTL